MIYRDGKNFDEVLDEARKFAEEYLKEGACE